MRLILNTFLSVLLITITIQCKDSPTDTPTVTGKTYTSAADAPLYDGVAFQNMQIFDMGRNLWLDKLALMEILDDKLVTAMGEQHENAAIQELELWLLKEMTDRHDDVSLAMEHFQHDEQGVLDIYLAGGLTPAEFEAQSQPWNNYATYWKPLVEHQKSIERPVIATNVPEEALDLIYAEFPNTPLAVFNGWPTSHPYDAHIPPRQIPGWDSIYQGYFETGFDYASHGQGWGLTYQEALDYFTDLAVIRDETMAYWIAQHVSNTSNRVLYVAGDWHVQTGLATPDRITRIHSPIGEVPKITTSTRANLATTQAFTYDVRSVANYILVYDPA